MSFHLLSIRVKQLQRTAKDLGVYTLLIAAAFIFFTYASYLYFLKNELGYMISLALVFGCFTLQTLRPDVSFVYKHLSKPYLELYSEYALLVFPFTVSALFTPCWYCFFLTYVLLIPVPLYKKVFQQKTNLKSLSRFIPASDFEWISGIRKMYLYLIFVYLLALVFCWVKIAPLFFLWIITTIYISFYEEGESLLILRAKKENPGQLLLRKSLRHARYLILICLPVLILNTLFYPDFLFINILFLLTQIILLLFCIYFKYSVYEPAEKMKANGIVTGMVSIGSLVPFFLPVPLIMAILYYFKAKKNLQHYLHD